MENAIEIEILPMDDNGIGLLVEAPTGVIYTNKKGGRRNLTGRMEGFYVPIFCQVHDTGIELIESLKDVYFDERGCLTEDGANLVDRILVQSKKHPGGGPFTSFLSVNRHKLKESYDGWIHVTLRYRTDYPPEQEDEVSWSACYCIQCEGRLREGILIFQN